MRENRSGYSGSGQTGEWLVHASVSPPEYGAMNRLRFIASFMLNYRKARLASLASLV